MQVLSHTTKWLANQIVLLRIAAVVAVLSALALAAPLIWAAASAGVGLAALGVIAILGAAIMQALPLFARKLENRLLAARKAEAQSRPIEQLQNFLLEKTRRVQAFKQAVVQIGAQVASLDDMMTKRKLVKPAYDSAKQERSLKAMREAHALLMRKYQRAEQALVELRDVVEDKKFEWSFGQAGQAALSNLNAASGQELLDQMLADEAFSSVRANFNQVFAELEIEATKLPNLGLATFDDGSNLEGAIDEPTGFKLFRR
jgi:ATP-dependent protease HslVU (ClpYQ) peptidase subunit